MIGLLLGSAAAFANYFLLKLAVGRLLGVRNIFVVQIFLFRYLLYIAAAYVSMRAGRAAVLQHFLFRTHFKGGEMSLAIFIASGIGGVKKQ